MTGVELAPDEFVQIGRVVPAFHRWRDEPFRQETPLDPITLAGKLVALAKRYDQDARDARQAAATCRSYASALRSGTA